MKKLLWCVFLPCFTFSQSIDYTAISLSSSEEWSAIDSSYFSESSQKLNHIIALFQQKRYSLFLKESISFKKQNPQSSLSNHILWLQAHAHLQEKNSSQALPILTSLTTITDLSIRHRALLDLYQHYRDENNISLAQDSLQKIHEASPSSPYQEIAHLKLIEIALLQKKYPQTSILMDSFQLLHPKSRFLKELQYYNVLSKILSGDSKRAREEAETLLSQGTNNTVQRLMGELELQEKKYKEALSYFVPLAKTINPYQDEALFKAGLLYKYQQEFHKAHRFLNLLVQYHQNSPFYERAAQELASVNILLKRYDDALVYYLRESGYSDTRKAIALLKITEIHFLKTNTSAVLRTGARLQKIFPYSSYANESLYWMGRALLLDQDFQESIKIFDDYLIREPQSPKKDEILIFLGHAYAQIDNAPKARFYFQQILRESSDNKLKRQALMGLGHSYHDQEPKRSLEYYDRVWKAWPKAPESDKALYYSAAVRYNIRENTESLKYFKDLVKNYPESPFFEDAHLAIAKLEFKAENFDQIINTDDIVITENNKEVVAEFKELQARSFFRIGAYEKALPLFQEAIQLTKLKQRETELFLAEASTLRALERHEEAVQNYERYLSAIKKTKESSTLEEILWAEMALSYLEIPNISKAEDMISSLEKQFPKSTALIDLYFKLADEYALNNKHQKAASYYQKVRTQSPDKYIQADALMREAWSLDESRSPETLEVFRLFLSSYPEHFGVPNIMLRLAELEKTRDPENSDLLFQKLIASHPESPEADQARSTIIDKLTYEHSMDDYYKALSQTSDKALRAKYLYKMGLKMEYENALDNALQLFLDVHKLKDPTHGAEALLRAGDLMTKKGQYNKSLQLSINVIAQYDEIYYAQALDRIIQNYILLEDFANAEKFRDRLLKQYPKSKESQKWEF